MSLSLSIIFGVVPVEISEWKPEIAPHAIVMNTNGYQRAGNDRAAAVHELRKRRRLQRRVDDDHAEREKRDRADLHERAEVSARRQQHPHRQHRCDEGVDGHRGRDLVAREHEDVAVGRLGERPAEDDGGQDQR